MVWTLKSSKTGQEYDFDDDVEPAKALEFIKTKVEPDQPWGNVIETIPRGVEAELAKQQVGALQTGEDFIRKPLTQLADRWLGAIERGPKALLETPAPRPDSEVTQRAKTYADEVQQKLKAETQGVPSVLQQGVSTGGASLLAAVPEMVTGAGVAKALTKAGVPLVDAVGKALGVGLTSMAAREGSGEYAEQREAGVAPGVAAGHAVVHGLAEYIPERFAFTPLLKVLRGNDPGALGAIGSFLARDFAGEQATTVMEWLNRKLSREPETTLDDLWREAQVTAVGTTLGGPVQGGMSAAAFKLALYERAKAEVEQEDAAAERVEPTIPPIEPTTTPTEVPPSTGKTRLPQPVVLGELPGNSEESSRTFDLNTQLVGLREAWKKLQAVDVNTTTEERIRLRGDFLARRKSVENELIADPAQRAFLLSTDLAMGVRLPDVRTQLELDVIESHVLSEAELQARSALAGPPVTTEEPDPVPDLLKQELGMQGYHLRPSTRSDFEWSTRITDDFNQHAQESVVYATDPANVGRPLQEVFDTMRPGEVVFAGSPSLSAALAQNPAEMKGVQTAVELASNLAKVFFPNQRLVIVPNSDPTMLGAAAALPGTGNGLLMYLGVRPVSAEVLDEGSAFAPARNEAAKYVDTIVHEMTHMVHQQHWEKTPAAEKKSVAEEYHDDLAFAADPRNSARQVIERLFSPATAERILANAEVGHGIDVDKPGSFLDMKTQGVSPFGITADGRNGPDYWFNFSEWMAHKGVKYALTRLGVRQENQNFFKRLINSMRKMWATIHTALGVGPAFTQWMDNIAIQQSGLEGLNTPAEIEAARKELVTQGMLPELANLLTAVQHDKAGVLRRNAALLATKNARDSLVDNAKKLWNKIGFALRTEIGTLSFDKLAELVKDTQLGQALLNAGHFRNPNPDGRNVLEFWDAFFHHGYGKYIKRSQITGGTMYTFRLNEVEFSVQWNRGLQTLFRYDSREMVAREATPVQLGVLFHAMRHISQTEGVGAVKLDGFHEQVTEWLQGKDVMGDTQVELPYFIHSPPVAPSEQPQDFQIDLNSFAAGLNGLGQRLGAPFGQQMSNAVGRFNAFFSKMLGAYELISLNEQIPGMLQERQALRNRMAYRHKWIKIANQTVEDWAFKLPKDQAAKMSKLLFDEAESGRWMSTIQADPNNPGQRVFILDPRVVSSRGLSQKTQEMYSQVRNDLMRFADEWHKVGLWEIARSEFDSALAEAIAEGMRTDVDLGQLQTIMDIGIAGIGDPALRQAIRKRVDELNTQFENWKSKPYMPYSRFGRWGVLVRGQDGKTKYFAGYDTKKESYAEAERLRAQFAGDSISTTYLEDVPYSMVGLPPAMLQSMKGRLQLTPGQEAAFGEILSQLSHANSFIHRAERKKGVEGYTKDALRAYSDYFRRGAAYLARVKSEPELNDAMRLLKKHIEQTTADGVNEPSHAENLGRLHEWFTRLHTYLNQPGNEYGEVKSVLALWHFGFNIGTAVVNLFQVPLFTVPYLTQRYNAADVAKELARAGRDIAKMYAKKSPLTPDESAMLEHALEQGFRDESQATVLAQIADGSALARASPLAAWRRGLNHTNHYAMWMFSKGELLNRDLTLLMTYRLARQKAGNRAFHGKFDRAAFDEARTTTEDTHNEYAQENRPEIMRGAGGVVFQFMHYVQHMLFLQLGGDASWLRLLLVQASMAGLLGLPFAKDILNVVKLVGRRVFGEDWDVEREAREYITQVGADPDLVLRGLASNFGDFDLSQRISSGEVVPGMSAIGSHRKLEQVMYDAAGDIGGPAAGVFLNALSFLAEDDKLSAKSLMKIMPTGAKNLTRAVQAFREGGVKDNAGASLMADPTGMELLGYGMGFMPERLTERYSERQLQNEQAAYWTNRRQALLNSWGTLVLDRDRDREATADFMKKLREFNEKAPDPGLLIKAESLREHVKRRVQANLLKEQGFGSNPATRQASRAIRDTFPSAPSSQQ